MRQGTVLFPAMTGPVRLRAIMCRAGLAAAVLVGALTMASAKDADIPPLTNDSAALVTPDPLPAPAIPAGAAPSVARICALIAENADQYGLPRDFFARLIWKESRFDHQAESPVGAQGIAQFMPYTAKERGLADPFDIEQAIPASASFLHDLHGQFGNIGLAAAAYNAGPNRVARWLKSGGFLPLETEDYVLDITGRNADDLIAVKQLTVAPLDPGRDFTQACERLPVVRAATIPMSRVKPKAWGIQVAGNFRRSVAIRQWNNLQRRFPAVLAGQNPVVSRMRTAMGRRGIYAVRLGSDSRAEANKICSNLKSAGGACIVLKNR